MTRKEAITRYLEANPKSGEMINRLITWNPKLSLIKNTINGNFNSSTCALLFAKKFKLNHVSCLGRPKG
jgi:hypothetical protein